MQETQAKNNNLITLLKPKNLPQLTRRHLFDNTLLHELVYSEDWKVSSV